MAAQFIALATRSIARNKLAHSAVRMMARTLRIQSVPQVIYGITGMPVN